MTKFKAVILVYLFVIFSPVMAMDGYLANFGSVKQMVDACLPVKALPPLLTVTDIEAIEKDSGAEWCS
ncbi:MAG: hypothetical protein IMF12_04480, partial [Proteobacteria bacterium]|nr:hypothetical protein [Pseudomonadota bacterium]